MRFLTAACLLFLASLWLWSQTGSAPAVPTPAEQKAALEKARDEITASAADLDQALAELSRRAYIQPPSQSTSRSAIQWLKAFASRGTADSELVRGSQERLAPWITGLGDGSRVISPAPDLPAAMEPWRAHRADAIEHIHQAVQFEEDRQKSQSAMAQAKPETLEWSQARTEESKHADDLATALGAAQKDLETPLAISKPFTSEDRGASPFSGPVTDGAPSSLWLYVERSSAMIGEPVDAQIGLANDAGPNCAADRPYTVELKCDGCQVTQNVTFEAADRSKRATVKLGAKSNVLHASAGGLKAAAVNINGCAYDPQLRIISQMRSDSAPADGVTPVSVLVLFEGSAGDPATNGHQKILDLAPHGLGVQRNPAPHSGHILKNGREYLDIDECSSGQELVATHSGAATLDVKYMNDALTPSPQFHFWYIWRGEDLGWWAAAGLVSWLAVTARRILRKGGTSEEIVARAGVSLLGSIVGAAFMLEVAYLSLSHFDSVPDTRIPCAAAGIIGGAFGLGALRRFEIFQAKRAAESAE